MTPRPLTGRPVGRPSLGRVLLTVRLEARQAKELRRLARQRPRLPSGQLDLSAVVRELLDQVMKPALDQAESRKNTP